MLERDIQKAVVKYARHTLGLCAVKLATRAYRSYPDFIFFIPGGRPLLIEFKRTGEQPTAAQAAIHEDLHNAAYTVQIHDTIHGGKAALLGACLHARAPTGQFTHDHSIVKSELAKCTRAMETPPVPVGRGRMAGAAPSRGNTAGPRNAENQYNVGRLFSAKKAALRK